MKRGGEGRQEGGDSTLRRIRPAKEGLRPVWHRRLALAVLAVIVAFGATGLLGVHSRTVTAQANGFTLTVTYAGVARSGLDVPFRIELTSQEPLTDEIDIAISGKYFDIFETQGFHPQPSGEAGDGSTLYFTFDPPPAGNTFAVDYDAYIQPSSQRGEGATISYLVDDEPVVSVDISTFLLP